MKAFLTYLLVVLLLVTIVVAVQQDVYSRLHETSARQAAEVELALVRAAALGLARRLADFPAPPPAETLTALLNEFAGPASGVVFLLDRESGLILANPHYPRLVGENAYRRGAFPDAGAPGEALAAIRRGESGLARELHFGDEERVAYAAFPACGRGWAVGYYADRQAGLRQEEEHRRRLVRSTVVVALAILILLVIYYRHGLRQARERERMEQSLQQAGKLAALGEMASGVAHEINNPLATITGQAQSLLKQVEGGADLNAASARDRFRRYLASMVEQSFRLKVITSRLLDFARIKPPEPQTLDLRQIIDGACELTAHQLQMRKLTLARAILPTPFRVRGDLAQLQQVLVNLLLNAVEASPADGTITIATGRRDGKVFIAVRDQGAGLGEDVKRELFKPFFTTKPPGEGTGLGLVISARIAADHRGRLEVESAPGAGASFALVLPEVTE